MMLQAFHFTMSSCHSIASLSQAIYEWLRLTAYSILKNSEQQKHPKHLFIGLIKPLFVC